MDNRRVRAERIVDRVRHVLNRGVQIDIVEEELEKLDKEWLIFVKEVMENVRSKF